MIDFLSSWTKGIALSVVVVSILEMLLPNNKSKKYIRMVMGIFIIFSIISPLVENKKYFDIDNYNFEQYMEVETESKDIVDQTSMDKRIQELYEEELVKDITKKVEEKGYKVNSCDVKLSISENKEDTKIDKIKLNVEKSDNQTKENEDTSIENKITIEIQKIKPVNTNMNENETQQKAEKITSADIQNIKNFLIEEYEVNEKCLKIN